MILLGALAIFMAGCSKNIEPSSPDPDAWRYDVSLPVPIEFGTPSVATKASYIKDLSAETKNFGVFGIDKASTDVSSTSKQLLYNAPAVYNAETKTLDLAVKTFYPMTNTAFFNFYSYYTSKSTTENVSSEGRRVYVLTDLGNSDILYGSTKVTGAQRNTVGCDGYNAKYIRAVNNNGTINEADYLPTINFVHVTSALQFYVQTPTAASEKVFTDNNISIKNISVTDVPTKAKLCLVDLDSDVYSQDGQSVSNSAEGRFLPVETGSLYVRKPTESNSTSTLSMFPKVTPMKAGDPLFIAPQAEAISGQIAMQGYPFDPIPFELDPAVMETLDNEFKAGHIYNIYLTVHSPEKVTITVTVEAWKDGFTGGDYYENNPGFGTELG